MAAPSRRNSGLETTAKSASGRVSAMMRSTSSPVPTGTVDLVTTTVKPSSARGDLARGVIDEGEVGMAVAAARGRADGDEHGVGRLDRRLPASVVKVSRPALTLAATRSSRPGS